MEKDKKVEDDSENWIISSQYNWSLVSYDSESIEEKDRAYLLFNDACVSGKYRKLVLKKNGKIFATWEKSK